MSDGSSASKWFSNIRARFTSRNVEPNSVINPNFVSFNEIIVPSKESTLSNSKHVSFPVQNSTNNSIQSLSKTQTSKKVDDIDDYDEIENSLLDITLDAGVDTGTLADKSKGTVDFFRTSAATKLPALNRTHYSDWSTIDWLSDVARDGLRHQVITEQKTESLWRRFISYHDALSGWFCVLLVAINIGIIAAIVDIGAVWLAHLKNGICLPSFWLHREQCCWTSRNNTYNEQLLVQCEQWHSWSKVFHIENDTNWEYAVNYLAFVVLGCIFASLGAMFVKMFAPYASGSGVPEVKTILSGFIIRGYLGRWTVLIKSMGMILGTSANLILGLFPKYGQNEAKKREILSASAAAGVSVAFGAPIGGVLFSLEEVSYYFPLKTLWRSLFCAMVASLVVKLLSPFENQHLTLFNVGDQYRWFYFELIPFILLGVLGGLFGALFIKLNLYWCKMRKRTKLGQYPVTEVICIALLTLLVTYPNPFTRISMADLIRRLISSCGVEDTSNLCNYARNVTSANDKVDSAKALSGVWASVGLLVLTLVTQIGLFIITFGIKIPCGLFIPSMTIGAITGRIVGILFEALVYEYPTFFLSAAECSKADEECVAPAFYALIGSCAFLGGVTRMTVSLVVIMVELTGGLSYSVPLMCAALVAKLVGDALVKEGIYDAHINLNNYPYLDIKEEFSFNRTTAVDLLKSKQEQQNEQKAENVTQPPLITLNQDGMSLHELTSITRRYPFRCYPVIISKSMPYLVGIVSRRDLQLVLNQAKSRSNADNDSTVHFTRTKRADTISTVSSIKLYRLLNRSPITVTNDTPVETIIDMCRKLGAQTILITDNGKLTGLLTKKDVIQYVKRKKEQK
ncbi:unnamed protein product [Didymodactylos carnosus]|uniref:Chloride channel protein n=1 Tax=Didymodactylos carnosus TaxID=1234261 RepID=A0A813PYX7_9BILA|nr:unnamed protein product [Didymodactylos carnosus]CAF1215225.1 unnamed protein product [Didymodactylos carnosus]CAF3541703.1 unnamed protein product [Didymodactylos carnosus]CAF4023832.1 unnamed protein product [Didymodactylos carnosus]